MIVSQSGSLVVTIWREAEEKMIMVRSLKATAAKRSRGLLSRNKYLPWDLASRAWAHNHLGKLCDGHCLLASHR